MITAFLLAPVLAVLLWLYARLLPENSKLRFFDYTLFTIVIMISSVFVHLVQNTDWRDAGPLWPEVVAALGVYGIWLGGLAAGLFWRRYKE